MDTKEYHTDSEESAAGWQLRHETAHELLAGLRKFGCFVPYADEDLVVDV